MSSNNIIDKFFGKGPYPFPMDELVDNLDIYYTDNVCVCITKHPTIFNEDSEGHTHDSFEFIIPNSPMQSIFIDKKPLATNANTLIPINSNQAHGPSNTMSVDCLLAVQIAADYLKEVSYQISSSSFFSFENAPISSCNQIKQLMHCFINESVNKQAGYRFILDSLSTQLSVGLLRYAKLNHLRKIKNEKLFGSKDIKKVIEFFSENYTSNNYSSAEIAKLANLSTYHFIRAFKQHTGKTPYEYLIDLKIEKAKEMLRNRRYSITDVCFSCGFSNHSHFSTLFKKRLGVTPTEYRSTIINV